MTREALLQEIKDLDINQRHLAKLLGVTPRAVQFWVSGDRQVPGPVVSYLRVLKALPTKLRVIEIDGAQL